MATVLAAQLAQIRTQTTNPLDLKAQKKAHSQSLLFESRIAATQDFDTIYQLCYEGYEELCQLDPRFAVFAGNLFSEQSKQEDRTQMTSAQNEQLDLVLEAFLALVGSKLLLKPALKSVEWLVRRFRVHEYNTLCLALTFLPYHTTPMFPTMSSILPARLPSTLRFMAPYIQSLTCPPRHTIVYTASNSKPFVTVLSTFVLKCSSQGYQYPMLISFWASLLTEAVAAMMDQARSARRESQKQNQQDVLIFTLPILNEALSFHGIPELRIGCYMILTVLACKASLGDDVLSTMMEAVISGWKGTSHAGLICLSVLAQQKEEEKLPKKVVKALLLLDGVEDDLTTLKQQYKVDRLALGMVLGVLGRLKNTSDETELRMLKNLVEGAYMEDASMEVALRSIVTFAKGLTPEVNPNVDIQGSLTDLILRLAESEKVGRQMQSAIEDIKLGEGALTKFLQPRNPQGGPTQLADDAATDVIIEDADQETTVAEFELLTSRIPTRTAYGLSFLSHSDSYIYDSLAKAFAAVSALPTNIERFSNLPVLRKSLALTEPLFLSFFIRIWCGNRPAQVKAAAIRTVDDYLQNGLMTTDLQILLPYTLHGLADSSTIVRRAMAGLVLSLSRFYDDSKGKERKDADRPVLGREQIYGQGEESRNVSWLTSKDTNRFLNDLLVPGLEECLLDQNHITQLLSDNLNGSNHGRNSRNIHKELKSSLRLSVLSFLCSHVVNTPLLALKSSLLPILNRVEKVGSTSRTKLLLPLLSKVMNLDCESYEKRCQEEGVDPSGLVDQAISVVVPTDRDGIQTLRSMIESPRATSRLPLRGAALQRIIQIWPSIKPDLQTLLAELFLELAVPSGGGVTKGVQDIEVIETLRALPLAANILNLFLVGLPNVLSMLPEKSPASKRRRLSHTQFSEAIGIKQADIDFAIQRTTFVLELVENSKVERHPDLLKGLFRVMADLQHSQIHAGSGMAYLQVLAMESILAIVKKAGITPNLKVDVSGVRADVLIDCIRTTTSPQVRNNALLLVSALANVAPELILHSVMPVFTFMGTNVMRQEDEFSTHVVQKTMESVIPRLVQSLHKSKTDPLIGVSELLLSFAAAFEHIPSQRRLGVYTSLVDKVNPALYLFAFLAILLEKYPNNPRVLQFAIEITSQYDVQTQLKMVDRYMAILLDAWKPKPTISATVLSADEKPNAERINVNLFPLVPAVLGAEGLVLKMSKALGQGGEGSIAVRTLYAQILEQILVLSDKIKSRNRLELLSMQALDASLGLVPVTEMVNTLEMLLSRVENRNRMQVLRSFEYRLDNKKVDVQAAQTSCLGFLTRLVTIINESSDEALNVAAVSCIDRIVERFGKKDVAVVLKSARVIAGDTCLDTKNINLRVASLLCLATMVEAAADTLVPIVPTAFSKAMDSLHYSISKGTENASLHNAACSLLVALLLYVPWMLASPDLDRLLKGWHESANAEMGEECNETRIEAMKLMPHQIEAKACFTVLDMTWESAMASGPIAVQEQLDVLRLAIERQPKSMIVKQSETLGDFFLKAFDLRRIQLSPRTEDSYRDEEIELVEDAVNETAIAMVYKLNDAAFRPMFTRIMEWATTSAPQKGKRSNTLRRTTLYTFVLKLFATLKSIVTSYASFILDDATEVLRHISPTDEDAMHLWRRVIQTLHKSFEHDQDDFYQSPAHFGPVSTALLSQLSHAGEIPMIPEAIPAIAELAVATDSSAHHKEMNAAILKYMRSDSAAVRLAAVQCERALTDRLGEEWLSLLPEMLPFISELQEDDDEDVEKETLRWIGTIENILGESLNPMLQ